MIVIILWLLTCKIISIELSGQITAAPQDIINPSNDSSIIPMKSMVPLDINTSEQSLHLFKNIYGSNGIPNAIHDKLPSCWLEYTYVIESIASFWWDKHQLNIIGLFNQWNDPWIFHRTNHQDPQDYIFLQWDHMVFLFFKNKENSTKHYMLRLLPVDQDLLTSTTIPSSRQWESIEKCCKKYLSLIVILTIVTATLIICIIFSPQ